MSAVASHRLPHRRRFVRHRGRQGAARARRAVRLHRGVRPRRRQLGLRQPQRDVGGLPRPPHQHVARADGVLGLPDAGRLPRLPAPHARSRPTSTTTSTTSASATSIIFDTRVEKVVRGADGGCTSPPTTARRARYDAVLVANGHHWDPRWPEPAFPGAETFAGEQMHAHDYVDAGDLRGQERGRARHGQLGDGHRGRGLLRRQGHLPGGAPRRLDHPQVPLRPPDRPAQERPADPVQAPPEADARASSSSTSATSTSTGCPSPTTSSARRTRRSRAASSTASSTAA